MSIETGDRIFVGKKYTSVEVKLSNPTIDMIKECVLDEKIEK